MAIDRRDRWASSTSRVASTGVGWRHRARLSASSPRYSCCSTSCATVTTTCRARSPRAGCGCRSVFAPPRAAEHLIRVSEIALDDGRPMLRARRRGMGRADRQERPVRVPQRQAHAGVAQDEAPQAAGVRGRRMDRPSPDTPALRIATGGVLRRRRAAVGGIVGTGFDQNELDRVADTSQRAQDARARSRPVQDLPAALGRPSCRRTPVH